jgi:hypothetical protein
MACVRCAAGFVDVAITPPPDAWVSLITTLPTHNSVTPQPTRATACLVVSLVALVTLGSVPPPGLLVRSVPTSMALLRQCAPVVGFQSY